MHQLEKKNIPWDIFITNEVFTTPPSQCEQSIPSSSHPPISTSPSQPVAHTSSPSQIHSHHVDPTSSPFHNLSPSTHHDTEASSSEKDIEVTWANVIDVEPFPKTY